MPLYEYECESCNTRFERIQKFSDPPVDICPSCGAGTVKKLLSSPAIQFKGSGWYITDYAKKAGGDSDKGKAAGDTASKETASKDAGVKDAGSKAAPSSSTSEGSSSSAPSSKKD